MKFHETTIEGVFRIEPEPIADDRGHFARVWSKDEYAEAGLSASWVQSNVGFSHRAGTIRGMHFQIPPHEEAKLVSCPRGRLFDVAVDLRVDSPTRYEWVGVELSAENQLLLYVPPGCAHGYQTLEDSTQLMYMTDQRYAPSAATGIRWDDPRIGVEWPAPVSIVSEQDRKWALIEAEESNS